ncbi:hypothetical protein [Nioella nitratireducens]|uniref:hypothetical protein n=1 Tax=Nioella nitratireducens TaxID=1287720 RepID=UPI0008FD1E51|nr:hypothetical protein [Nioella nitratireducens]
MNKFALAASALLASTAIVQAGGLDRSGQSTSAIFADDGATSLSFGVVMPSVSGTDALGNSYDVGDTYTQFGFSYTNRINDAFSYAVILDQPYGANITYGNSPLTSTLGGTMADLSSTAATFVGRYEVGGGFSVFGGIGVETVQADVALNGIAYRNAIATSAVARTFNAGLPAGATQLSSATLGAAVAGNATAQAAIDTAYGAGTFAALAGGVGTQATNFATNGGYRFNMQDDAQPTYLIGGAYEIPDIALRLAVTYRFETDHSASTTENMFGLTQAGTVNYVTPRSLNIDFQTGIAEDTLLTASYRWTEFSSVDVVPLLLGSDLVNLDDSERYTLGVGRRFSDALSGSLTLIYEPEGDPLVSPLGPTNGMFGVTLGMRYTEGNMNLSGGINYSWLGDALPEVGGVAAANFTGNSAVGVGFQAQFTF